MLFKVLGNRHILYGEWLYAKHSVYYDNLPHYFLGLISLTVRKIEENRQVTGRLKFVRTSFTQTVKVSQIHWLDRPIIPNGLSIPVEAIYLPGKRRAGWI